MPVFYLMDAPKLWQKCMCFPKYQMKLALEKPEELQSRLDLFLSCLHEDPELMMRQSLGNVHTWSFKRHKSLFLPLRAGVLLGRWPSFGRASALYS